MAVMPTLSVVPLLLRSLCGIYAGTKFLMRLEALCTCSGMATLLGLLLETPFWTETTMSFLGGLTVWTLLTLTVTALFSSQVGKNYFCVGIYAVLMYRVEQALELQSCTSFAKRSVGWFIFEQYSALAYYGLIRWFHAAVFYQPKLFRENYLAKAYRLVIEGLRWLLVGVIDDGRNNVLYNRTGIVEPTMEAKKNLVKDLLSVIEFNLDVPTVGLEAINVGYPLMDITDAKGDLLKCAKATLAISTTSGMLVGMATLVKTPLGDRIVTVGHVLRNCLNVAPEMVVSSIVTGKAVKLTQIEYTRVTVIRVADRRDCRVELAPPADFGALLGVRAVALSDNTTQGYAVMFSPPEATGKPFRYSTGKVLKIGGGFLEFKGSTVNGSSGGGMFVGCKHVACHSGNVQDKKVVKNVAFYNFPRKAPEADKSLVDQLLSSFTGYQPESAWVDSRVWVPAEFEELQDSDYYEMTDIELDEAREARAIYYAAERDKYAIAETKALERIQGRKMIDLLISQSGELWANDEEEEEEDQNVLQDQFEEQRVGYISQKRGLSVRGGVVIPRAKARLESAIAGAVKTVEDEVLIGESVQREGSVETPTPHVQFDTAQDFGLGERSPRPKIVLPAKPSETVSVQLESTLNTITPPLRVGTLSQPSSSLKKKSRKKKKAKSSNGGGGGPSGSQPVPSIKTPSNTALPLSWRQKLQDTGCHLAELQQLASLCESTPNTLPPLMSPKTR